MRNFRVHRLQAAGAFTLFLLISAGLSAHAQGPGMVPKLKKAFVLSNGGPAHAHSTIPMGNQIMQRLASGDNPDKHKFQVFITDKMSDFTSANLAGVEVLVLNNCTHMGRLLNAEQKQIMIDFVEKGGKGVAGWHGATDTWYRDNWPWYVDWISAVYVGSANWVPTRMNRSADGTGAKYGWITSHWANEFNMIAEEWYQFKPNPVDNPNNKILLSVNVQDVGATKASILPYAWVNEEKKGRLFMTGFGHKEEIMQRKDIVDLLYKGIVFAAGGYENATVVVGAPESAAGSGLIRSTSGIEVSIARDVPHTVRLSDMSGRVLAERKAIGTAHYAFRELERGAYFVEVRTPGQRTGKRIALY